MRVAGVSITYEYKPPEHFSMKYVVLEQPDKLIDVGQHNCYDIHQVDQFFKSMAEKYNTPPIVVEVQSRMRPLLNRVWEDGNSIHLVDVTTKKREECYHVVWREFSVYAPKLDSDHVIAFGLALLYRPPLWTTRFRW